MSHRYFAGLYALRAYAALSVVNSHLQLYPPRWFRMDVTDRNLLDALFLNNAHSVTLFLVLSGFLTTSRFLESGIPKDFHSRRWRRFLPPYYAALVISVLVSVAFPYTSGAVTTVGLLAALPLTYYLHHVVSSWTIIAPFWTLNMIEHFYLFFVPIMRVFRPFTVVIGVMFITKELLDWLAWTADDRYATVTLSVIRIEPLLIGALFAWLCRQYEFILPTLRRLWLPIALAFVVLIAADEEIDNLNLVSLLMAFAIAAAGHIRVLEYPMLVALGKRSYGIYCWHTVALYTICSSLCMSGIRALSAWLLYPAIYALTLFMAEFSYRFLEQRFSHVGQMRASPIGLPYTSVLLMH